MLDNSDQAMDRRTFIATVGTTGAIGLAGCSAGGNGNGSNDSGDPAGSDYPSESIEMICPFGAGGGYDYWNRVTAKYLAEELSVNIEPKNVTGGVGRVAIRQVYNSDPTGYKTVLPAVQTAIRQQLTKDVDFDMREFSWLPKPSGDFRAINVGPDTGIDSWDTFVQKLTAGEIKVAIQGPVGGQSLTFISPGAIGGEYSIEDVLDNAVTVDSQSHGQTMIERGEVQAMAGSAGTYVPAIEDGKLEPLLLFSTEDEAPSGVYSEAQTLSSAGIPKAKTIAGINNSHRIFAAPPDLSDNRLEILGDAMWAAITNNGLVSEAEESGRAYQAANYDKTTEIVNTAFEGWEENISLLKEIEQKAGQ